MNLTEPQAGSDLALVRSGRAPGRWQPHLPARRSSSPLASTTWPTTSSTLVLARTAGRRRGSRASRLHRAQVPGQRRRQPGRATTSTARPSIQDGHQGLADRGAGLWRRQSRPVPSVTGRVKRTAAWNTCSSVMNAARYAVGRPGHRRGRAPVPEGGDCTPATACSRGPVDGARPPEAVAIIHHPTSAHAAVHALADRGRRHVLVAGAFL